MCYKKVFLRNDCHKLVIRTFLEWEIEGGHVRVVTKTKREKNKQTRKKTARIKWSRDTPGVECRPRISLGHFSSRFIYGLARRIKRKRDYSKSSGAVCKSNMKIGCCLDFWIILSLNSWVVVKFWLNQLCYVCCRSHGRFSSYGIFDSWSRSGCYVLKPKNKKGKKTFKNTRKRSFYYYKAKPALSADLRETAPKITILAGYSELTDKHSLPTVKELRVLRLFAVWSVWLSS